MLLNQDLFSRADDCIDMPLMVRKFPWVDIRVIKMWWKSIHRKMNTRTLWKQNIAVHINMKWCG